MAQNKKCLEHILSLDMFKDDEKQQIALREMEHHSNHAFCWSNNVLLMRNSSTPHHNIIIIFDEKYYIKKTQMFSESACFIEIFSYSNGKCAYIHIDKTYTTITVTKANPYIKTKNIDEKYVNPNDIFPLIKVLVDKFNQIII